MKIFLYASTLIMLSVLNITNARGQNPPSSNTSDFNKKPQILPPPPNAASLGKYGGTEINLSSGAVNFSIPLYNYNSKDINVPISLSYTSNGVKVDEIASRVGSGWNLNCGGVITRTVYGDLDDYTVNGAYPAMVPSLQLQSWMDAVVNPANVYVNSQPDIFTFNFNGYSGKFILDTALNVIKIQGNPILLEYSSLKIQSAVDGYKFKITTPDGVQYFFGSNSSTETSYGYPTGGGCGMPYDYYESGTAFYLSKIVHPNNDVVEFSYAPITYNYKTGVSETIYKPTVASQPCSGSSTANTIIPAPLMQNTVCLNWLETRGVLLQEVNSNNGGKVKFNYTSRNDGVDRLVSSIEIYKSGETNVFRTLSLGYQYSYSGSAYVNSFTSEELKYRPFLSSVIESSTGGLFTKRHSFTYNDINALPPRLSFAQDDYGFFNGKNNNTLIPIPVDPSYQQALPMATANRSVDPAFSTKGMLTSITYPTGGEDSVMYESNQVLAQTNTQQTSNLQATAYNQNLSSTTVSYSGLAVVSTDSQATLIASCSSTTIGETNFKTTNVYLTDETTNTILLNQTLHYNETLSTTFLLLASHSYKIRLTCTGDNVTGSANLSYQSGTQSSPLQSTNAAGVRVAKIITTDNVAHINSIKKYIYGSGTSVYKPSYSSMSRTRYFCPDVNSGQYDCGIQFDYYTMQSNPVYSLYSYGPAPTIYSAVTESFGNNYDNGGIEHLYTTSSDFLAGNYYGDPIVGSPATSFEYNRNKEIYQGIFKKQNGNKVYQKKVFTHYKEDSRVDHAIDGYVVSKSFQNLSNVCDPLTIAFYAPYNQYNLSHYLVYQKWFYPDTVRALMYDLAGQNYTEQKTVTEYGNPVHALPTKITTYTSDGLVQVQNNRYPQDASYTGDAEIGRQALISRMISPLLEESVTKGNNPVYTLKTEYNVFTNGLVQPKRKFIQTGNNSLEPRIEFNNYDFSGNIVDESQISGPHTSYLWGYNSQYPIAEAKNAKANEIYLANEEEGTDFPAGYIIQDGSRAHSGHYSGRIDNGNSSEVVYHSNTWLQVSNNTPKSYHYSGWVYSNGPSIDIFLFMKRAGEGGYFSYVDAVSTGETGKWVYLSKDFLVPADVTQLNLRVDNNGSTNGQVQSIWFDDLRIHPSNALMTNYTYDPLVGMTSQTDPKGMTTTYEYDSFQRLLNVKDKDGNIIKHNDYHYQNQ